MRKVYKVIQGTFHPTSRTFPPGGNAPDRSSDKSGGAFAATSTGEVLLTDHLHSVPAVDSDPNLSSSRTSLPNRPRSKTTDVPSKRVCRLNDLLQHSEHPEHLSDVSHGNRGAYDEVP
ncbi:hypothetical protein CTEST_04525 [Corynebacterium testudinoris]|uniref:Uncharacterized protein n=1 Tax=Corynebacterium testudinoris TaxID=136857 RepID=A0A0G3HB10_9CORY|nr:hypothetical protein CTEST_04525 [Corynebacterium testudinoris]